MKYPAHTSTEFDNELNALIEDVLKMGASVEDQLNLAMETLTTADLATIDRVIEMGVAVNDMEISIDDKCINLLVRRQPNANDFRLVKTIIRIINDLERIGDEAEGIARASRQLAQKHPGELPRYYQIKYIAEVAQSMLNGALVAFENMDIRVAKMVGHKDSLIDEEFRSVLRHVVAYMMEDSSELSTALLPVFIAKAIERIGDHAKNIGGHVVYMIEGR